MPVPTVKQTESGTSVSDWTAPSTLSTASLVSLTEYSSVWRAAASVMTWRHSSSAAPYSSYFLLLVLVLLLSEPTWTTANSLVHGLTTDIWTTTEHTAAMAEYYTSDQRHVGPTILCRSVQDISLISVIISADTAEVSRVRCVFDPTYLEKKIFCPNSVLVLLFYHIHCQQWILHVMMSFKQLHAHRDVLKWCCLQLCITT